MDRPPFSSGQIWRSFDVGNGYKDGMKAVGRAVQAMLGSSGSYVSGFGAVQQSVPNLQVTVGAGQIYTWSVVDGTPFGSLAADSNFILQQGYVDQQILTLTTGALSAGQAYYALIQVQFQQLDQVRTGDPTGGIIAFYNSINPPVPLQGPNGLGGTLNTVRLGFAYVNVIYGTAATIGSQVPPTPTGGFQPLYLISLQFGQLAIINSNIQVAGPGAYSGYQQAPFLAGLVNSHHNGAPGQAPKINLLTEIQNVCPFPNLPVSNTTPLSAGGTVTVAGVIPISAQGTVNPNSNWAGKVNDRFLNTTTNIEYVCTTTGTASTAVWTPVGGTQSGPTCIYVNTSPYTIANLFACYLFDASAGALTGLLPAVSTSTNALIEAVMVATNAAETNTVTLTPAGSDKFIYNGQVITGNLILSQIGDSRTLKPLTIPSGAMAGTYWVVT